MNAPQYSYPPGLFPRVALDVVLFRHRDFHEDAKRCVQHLKPSLQVFGPEHIPQQGPCVVTVNHYHRPGFGAQWIALTIAALVPVNMQWIMTAEFTYAGRWYEFIGAIGSQILLKRLATTYGFMTMPPMPPRSKDVEARAAAVRAVLNYVRHTKEPVIGLAPEGHDPAGPAGVLTRPPSGLGRFGLLMAGAGLRFHPVGAYEKDGAFCLNFGDAYELSVARHRSSDEKDRQASQIVMENIARLVPASLRGEFA